MFPTEASQELAPVLRVFGPQAGRMAALLRARPALLGRMAFAPARAIHAVGAFLRLSPEADRSDAEVAAMIDERDPRELLLAAIPEAPRRLYRCLEGAGDQVRQHSFYERLRALCASPIADVLLEGPISDDRLDWADAILRGDPALLSLRKIDLRKYEIEAIDTLVAYLRAHHAFEDSDLQLPDGSGLAAVLERIQQAFDRVTAPAFGFTLPPPFRVVQSVGELRRIGAVLDNCVRNLRSQGTEHWFQMAAGSTIYIASDTPAMLAALERVGPDLWTLDQQNGLENASLGGDAKALLIDALKIAGVPLLREDPANVLSMLVNFERVMDETETD
jgi:hypothetical protein